MTSINPNTGPAFQQLIIPKQSNPEKQVPLDPTVIGSVLAPFDDFDAFRRRKELQKLRELEEIWAFVRSKHKGPIMDVYFYLQDLCEESSDLVFDTASRILDFLDATRIRGL